MTPGRLGRHRRRLDHGSAIASITAQRRNIQKTNARALANPRGLYYIIINLGRNLDTDFIFFT